MIALTNDSLEVQLLHPIHDREKLGTRFCTGCYVYQINDSVHGPLLSGPEYPSPTPSVINGQGLPEVFQHTLFHDPHEVPEQKLIIGVGLVENSPGLQNRQSHFTSRVEQYCDWHIEGKPDTIVMETHQESEDWGLDIKRTIQLTDRTVRLSTSIRNTLSSPLPVRWFAHPFFPVPPGGQCCSIEGVTELEPNAPFLVDAEQWVMMHPGYRWREGYFLETHGADGIQLRALQHHPHVTRIRLTGDFPLMKIALWANDRTFSIEPFISATLQTGEELEWSMRYTFDEAGTTTV